MTDKLQRPEDFEFALDFLGDPEASELRAYIEQLEARAADLLEQRHPAPVPVASDIYFEFVISDADDWTQAGGIAPTYAQALSEGQHYLAQYQQDGPHTLELRRVEVLPPGAFPVPDDAPVPLPDDAQVIEPATHTILVPVPAPVPVSERLPGPDDCDAEGRCWWWVPACPPNSAFGDWQLHLLSEASYTAADATHWLPAIALPLPQGEVVK